MTRAASSARAPTVGLVPSLACLALVALGAGVGCEGCPPAEEGSPSSATTAEEAEREPRLPSSSSQGAGGRREGEIASEPTLPPPMRVTRVEGGTEGADPPAELEAGDLLEPGAAHRSGEHRVVLDLEGDARIEIEPSSHFERSGICALGIHLGRGRARVMRAARGSGLRHSVHLATPGMVVVVGGHGDAFVEVGPNGRTRVVGLAGLVDLFDGSRNEEGGLERRRLPAGRAHPPRAGLGGLVDDSSSLEDLRAARAVRGASDARARSSLATTLDASLGEPLAALRDVQERIERREAVQRAALGAGDREAAREAQDAIVDLARQKMSVLRRARLLLLRRSALALGGGPPMPDALAEAAQRVSEVPSGRAPGEDVTRAP